MTRQRPPLTSDQPLTIEVDTGSFSSIRRPPDQAWLVRLRRSHHSVIVATGLSHTAAHHLAAHIAELIHPDPPDQPDPETPVTTDQPEEGRRRLSEPTITLDRHYVEPVLAALQILQDWMLTCSQDAAGRLDHDHGPNTFALTWAPIPHHRCQLQRALDREP